MPSCIIHYDSTNSSLNSVGPQAATYGQWTQLWNAALSCLAHHHTVADTQCHHTCLLGVREGGSSVVVVSPSHLLSRSPTRTTMTLNLSERASKKAGQFLSSVLASRSSLTKPTLTRSQKNVYLTSPTVCSQNLSSTVSWLFMSPERCIYVIFLIFHPFIFCCASAFQNAFTHHLLLCLLVCTLVYLFITHLQR